MELMTGLFGPARAQSPRCGESAFKKDMERMGFREVAPGHFVAEEVPVRLVDKDLRDFESLVDHFAPAERPMDAYSRETDSVLASHQERLDNQAELIWRMERDQTARMDRLERRQVEDAAHLTKWLGDLEKKVDAYRDAAAARMDALEERLINVELRGEKALSPSDPRTPFQAMLETRLEKLEAQAKAKAAELEIERGCRISLARGMKDLENALAELKGEPPVSPFRDEDGLLPEDRLPDSDDENLIEHTEATQRATKPLFASFAKAVEEQREMDAKHRCPKGHQLWSGGGRTKFCPTCEGLDSNFQPRT